LKFSGGSDEGYLDVHLDVPDVQDPYSTELSKLRTDLDEYAWEVNPYSGAGDGNDYGDDYVFDLVKNTVSHSTWYMRREETDEGSGSLKIED
jgi:hypothetical protein